MDVTCLKHIDIKTEYFFRKHHDLMIVGNVMKCPKGSQLMLDCYNEAITEVTENNRDWHKPIEILNKNVRKHGLENFIFNDVSYPDRWPVIKGFIRKRRTLNQDFYFIHWMNEEWRSRGISKNHIKRKSTLGELMLTAGPLPSTEIQDAKLVGNYALQLEWTDGHGTGMYAFSALREVVRDISDEGDLPPLDLV